MYNKSDSYVKIIDDGKGMSQDQLFQAMKIGSSNPSIMRNKNDLGRFGLGMKTTSFAQGRKLTVLTYNGSYSSGACWDLDDIKDYSMEIFVDNDVNNEFTFPHNDKPQTEIIIKKLTRLTENATISKDWNKILVEAKDELRLIFHRYIEGSEKDIKKINVFNDDETPLSPINPFYEDHPVTQDLDTEIIEVDNKKFLSIHSYCPIF